jgi:hypothetical protein
MKEQRTQEVPMSRHSKQLDAILKRARLSAERQLRGLRREQFAVFKLLPDGGCLDWTPEQITALEKTIQELNEAIRLASVQTSTPASLQ